MTEDQKKWVIAKGRMMDAMKVLGFPEALGDELVKNLGSPNTAPDLVSGESAGFEASEESGRIPSYAAMDRMTSYLKNVKPKKAELVVDEMLAICSDIARWRDKKESERANAAYNEVLYFGLENLPDDED